MKDLAILVDNKNDSTEAQDLLFSMGYKWRGLGENSKSYFYPRMNKYFIFMNKNEMDLQMAGYFAGSSRSYTESRFKEITLPKLRDLVVLKRNDVGDATHYTEECGAKGFLTSEGIEYFYDYALKDWSKHKQSNFMEYQMKPIEKPTKEYLRKNSNGTYSYIGMVRPEHVSDFMIEIPEGANFAWKSDGKYVFFTALEMGYRDAAVVWQRHTLPEELPFIDDEPSLNDQYAEIEKVRQSAWQKQEGGSHYKNLKIQPMQYALENKLDYAQANVVKYVTRHKEKNGKEDLLKAIHNLELMIEFYYGDEK